MPPSSTTTCLVPCRPPRSRRPPVPAPRRVWWVGADGETVAGPAPLGRRMHSAVLVTRPRSRLAALSPSALLPTTLLPAVRWPEALPRHQRAPVAAGLATVVVLVGLGVAGVLGAAGPVGADRAAGAGPETVAPLPTLEFTYPPSDPAQFLVPAIPLDPGLAIPVEPVPVEPVPVEPIPVEPIPVEPIPVEPIPGGDVPGDGVPGGELPGGEVPGDGNPGGETPDDREPDGQVPDDLTEDIGPPLAAALLGRFELLAPVGGVDRPDPLTGPGLGLWSGGTGGPTVLVLGSEHEARAFLATDPATPAPAATSTTPTTAAPPAAAAPPPPARTLFLFHPKMRYGGYVLGPPRPLQPTEDLGAALSASTAPVVLVVPTADSVVLVEATELTAP